MLKILKKVLIDTARFLARCLSALPGGERFVDELINLRMLNFSVITHKGQEMVFLGANRLCRYRVETFATKEPDTLEWIDSMSEGAVLWDIGANVGLYSIYAAKQKKSRVFAFEPSVFNLEILVRNISANHLESVITIFPLALSDQIGASSFNLTSTNWGGALSTFGESYGQDGKKMSPNFEYQTYGIRISDAVSHLRIPSPNYIKLDVDGIEHLILEGGKDVLKEVDGVLVEINDNFQEQSSMSRTSLESAGLHLLKRRHMISGQYNQWWVRE